MSSYMWEVLHWLPIRQRIEYRVASVIIQLPLLGHHTIQFRFSSSKIPGDLFLSHRLNWRCQLGLAPTYLIDLCRPVSGSRSSRSMRSSERGLLSVPFAHATTMQSRASSVVAPKVWNGLLPALHLIPRTLSDAFYNQLKTVLFDCAGVGSTSE